MHCIMKQSINATKFKARCLELLDQVNQGNVEELEITKRGQVVARLCPPHRPPTSLAEWQSVMRNTVTIPSNMDLTAPIPDIAWEAE